jgi:hypothetical protein
MFGLKKILFLTTLLFKTFTATSEVIDVIKAGATGYGITTRSKEMHHSMGLWEGIVGNDLGCVDDGTLENITISNQNYIPFHLGCAPGGSDRFEGILDNVAIFNRALSESEIEKLYQNIYIPNP